MREVLDKFDKCEVRLSELLIDSVTDESEAKVYQDDAARRQRRNGIPIANNKRNDAIKTGDRQDQ